jgi:hypothetical protein
MKIIAFAALAAFMLMGAKCEQGSSINSADPAWCKTHYATKDACEKNAACKWDGKDCRAK